MQKYFTLENVPFSAAKNMPGGKGRGELDIIALKIDNKKGCISDLIHIEVSTSITAKFPFKGNKYSDESKKLLKKFFDNNSDNALKKYFDGQKWRYVLICSDFRKNIEEYLPERLNRWHFGKNIQE